MTKYLKRTVTALKKYGADICEYCYDECEAGNGGGTIRAQGVNTTGQADSAINAWCEVVNEEKNAGKYKIAEYTRAGFEGSKEVDIRYYTTLIDAKRNAYESTQYESCKRVEIYAPQNGDNREIVRFLNGTFTFLDRLV